MKIFEKNDSRWEYKVNFVDENNVLVGYDLAQDCCEDAGWFISPKKENKIYDGDYSSDEIVSETPNVSDYVFDAKFFEEVEDCTQLDAGKMVRFRLVNKDKELFLHLFNCHNGYYSHGFEMKCNNELIREDYL